jgi:DNA-binding transcriptional MerR regulator
MDDVINLIKHLLDTNFSIDRIDSIINHLQISKDHLLQLIKDDRYQDYFQLLRPLNNRNQSPEKIALTLDVSLR